MLVVPGPCIEEVAPASPQGSAPFSQRPDLEVQEFKVILTYIFKFKASLNYLRFCL